MASSEPDAEEWRVIPGHPDYEASSLGRVRSYKRCGRGGLPRLAAGRPDPTGYPRAFVDGKLVYIHSLVALAWHGPRPEGMHVDHVNHKRNDNRPENLAYVTPEANRRRVRIRPPATHCRRGHPLTEENVYVTPSNGARVCRACRRRAMAKRNAHDCYCGRPMPKASSSNEIASFTPNDEKPLNEEWRTIPDQPDYEVSNQGRVRSYRRCREADRAKFVPKIVKGYFDYEGYQRVMFADGKRRYMHQLVAEVFIGPAPTGHEVAHINHIRQDNRAENLRYATRQENLGDRYKVQSETCKLGHPLSGDNLYVERRGRRMCRICRRRRLAKRDPKNCPQCGQPLPEALRPLPHN